jgi:hypothetical protein
MGDVAAAWVPRTPVYGHVGRFADAFHQRVVCSTCGVICVVDFEVRGWIGTDVDLDRLVRDETYETIHLYGFAEPQDGNDDDEGQALNSSSRPGSHRCPRSSRQPPNRLSRAAIASAGYIDRARARGDERRKLASRSPEARRSEYERAKRREGEASRQT